MAKRRKLRVDPGIVPVTSFLSDKEVATWTTGTRVNANVEINVKQFTAVLLTQVSTGVTAGTVAVEGFAEASVNWFPVFARITGTAIVHNNWNIANAGVAWFIACAGFTKIRLRLTVAITGTGAVSDIGFFACSLPDASNPNPGQMRAGSAALTNVASSASNQTLLAASDQRIGVIIHNDSTSILNVKYGATASATSYTYEIGPGGTWEMPVPIFAGILDGIWDAANGSARITELRGL